MNVIKILTDLFGLMKNARLPEAQMKELQNRKLRTLLHFAWEHSAFYRRTFEKAGITEKQLDSLPLSAFPTIDKQILMEHFDELITVPDLRQEDLRKFDAENEADRKPYLGKYHVVHSSGSTGKPGYFIYDEAAWHTMLLGIIRGALWNMTMPLRYNYDKPEKPRRIKGFEVFSLVFSSFSKPKNHTEISRIIGGVSLTTNE